jgi:hypothetical protein
MKKMGFQYKITSGGAWSTAIELRCIAVSLYLNPEIQRETVNANGKKCQIIYPRVKITIELAWVDLTGETATTRTNAQALLHFANAPVRRIYNADTTTWPLLDQIATIGAVFNSASNTNYVNVVSFNYDKVKADDTGASGQALKNIVLELETIDKYTLTLT